MNEFLTSIILGVIQGVTEFAPVSSSGHLAITEHILGLSFVSLSYIAVIHLGTLVATLVYFHKDVVSVLKKLGDLKSVGWKIAVATIPAVIAGLLVADTIENAIQGVVFIAGSLFVTGLILLGAEWKIRKQTTSKPSSKTWETLSYADAIIIGLAQTIALIPGISRSGITMATGLIRGLSRADTARFSFLLSAPIVAGAGLISLLAVLQGGEDGASPLILITGFLVSFGAGLATIHFFLKLIQTRTLAMYGIYTICIAVIATIWSFFS